MGKLFVAIIVVIGVLAGAYFWLSSPKPAVAPAPKEVATPSKDTPSVPPAVTGTVDPAAQEITIVGNEFAFQPETFTIEKGLPVRITFKNTGKYPHNFTLPDLNVATWTVAPGEQASVQFTPTKAGLFPYSCTIDSHADKGMKGTLTVK